ncbi:MAG: hypothetical protein WCJ19_00120 [bacterium]
MLGDRSKIIIKSLSELLKQGYAEISRGDLLFERPKQGEEIIQNGDSFLRTHFITVTGNESGSVVENGRRATCMAIQNIVGDNVGVVGKIGFESRVVYDTQKIPIIKP